MRFNPFHSLSLPQTETLGARAPSVGAVEVRRDRWAGAHHVAVAVHVVEPPDRRPELLAAQGNEHAVSG